MLALVYDNGVNLDFEPSFTVLFVYILIYVKYLAKIFSILLFAME